MFWLIDICVDTILCNFIRIVLIFVNNSRRHHYIFIFFLVFICINDQSKEEQSDPLQSGKNTLPNTYVETEHSNSNIGELELYENASTHEDAGNHEDELNDVVYANENQKEYENIMMASAVVNENQNNSNEVAQDSVYTNVDEPGVLAFSYSSSSPMLLLLCSVST
jgi:hypothetical protein